MHKGVHRVDVGEHSSQQVGSTAELALALKGVELLRLLVQLAWQAGHHFSLPRLGLGCSCLVDRLGVSWGADDMAFLLV